MDLRRLLSPALLAMPLLCAVAAPAGASSFTTTSYNPSITDSAIDPESSIIDYHYVMLPATTPAPLLVVFLGGSLSNPADYQPQVKNSVAYAGVPGEAASLGFASINLRYRDADAVATVCGHSGSTADTCYTQYRGSVLYGSGVGYGNGAPYTKLKSNGQPYADLDNSIVNRLVKLLDCLANENDTAHCLNNGTAAYWNQFLLDKPGSPYSSSLHPHGVEPDWSKIIIAGHSQGGGEAGFLGVTAPSALHRVVMFSAPEDYYNSGLSKLPASWISTTTSPTPMSAFWGMRNTAEGSYGGSGAEQVNWGAFKDASNTGIGNPGNGTEASVGDGSGTPVPAGAQRLVTTNPDHPLATLYDHESTADTVPVSTTMDGTPFSNGRATAWDYLLSGNYAD
jgi:hypothetical protein